ncbi:stage III sporulation protein AG [Bacillus haikouensis]|jgi:stage III sporulation protein AG|uniref:stage III sporulation protein AG n=1 Tax=Bacillus haikouensis TaxID=1510468 RepID=UPI0015556332|nr:stage III sporulation protein AG [Bacillus haikouensis]NQD66072.1 stage III sporulation protein AG [Bacillus haikouensis]
MNFSKGPVNLIKEWLSKDNSQSPPPENKKGKKFQYFLIVLLLGVAFMLISDLWKNEPSVTVDQNLQEETKEDVPAFGTNKQKDSSMRSFEDQYENQLKEALDQIVGVSDALVVVNVEASEQKVYEKNENTQSQSTSEEDKEGGKRSIEEKSSEGQVVIIQDGEKEVPVISETRKPKVSGVLVVAKGADNIQIKKWILEAVTRVLDVPVHRVSVLPKD